MRHLKYLLLTLTVLGLAAPLGAHAVQPNFFTQNGNSFGNIAVLGTNDDFPLVFETNNVERVRIDEGGFLFTGTFDSSPTSEFHIKGGHFLFESADDFILKAPSYNPTASINLHFRDVNNNTLIFMEYDQTSSEPGFSIGQGGNFPQGGLFLSALNGNVVIGSGTTLPEATLQVVRPHNSFSNPNSTLMIGSEASGQNPGCLILGDSDGVGMTYIIANDGVLTASTTKPSICD